MADPFSSLIGAGISTIMAPIQNAWAGNQAQHAMDFSNASQQLQEQFYREDRSNQYQTAVSDMRAAGLNPMLAYSQGGAGAQMGAAPSGTTAPVVGMDPLAGAVTGQQVRNLMAQQENIDADTGLKKAQAKEAGARTETYPVSIDAMRASITKTYADVQNVIQQTRTGIATAQQLNQQTENLKATLPQIEALTDQLRAQAKATGAQASETQQRVQANMPKIEAALKNLQRTAEEMKGPERRNQQAAAESFAGQLGAYLDAILPLKGFFGAMK